MGKKKKGRRAAPGPAPAPAAGVIKRARVPWKAVAAIATLLLPIAAGALYLLRAGYVASYTLHKNPPRNLVLITLDTTRADHLGCYGYSLPTTPNLDRLAASGVLFEQAEATAPLTLPSHSTILTGLYPFSHGVRNNGDFYLPHDVPTLAGLLKSRGLATGAFVSSFILDSRYGLDHDFDIYDDHLERKAELLQNFEVERKGGETTRIALDWLSTRGSSPFFLWLHLYDPHETYEPPEPFKSRFTSAYDGEIAYADSLVGDVIGKLNELGLRETTLIVISGDHGESLGEHHEETHSIFIYNATMHVPVIFALPGTLPEGARVNTPVSTANIFATIVEIMGLKQPGTQDGWSMVPLVVRPSTRWDRPVYFESLFPKLYLHWAPLRGLRAGPWAYIDAPKTELYRVDTDPGETANLITSNPQIASEMRSRLEKLAPAGSSDRYNRQALDDETVAKLAGLGYIAAAAYAGAGEAAGDLPDPKDKIAFFNVMRDAQKEIRRHTFDRAIPMLEGVVAKEPDNAVALLFLASGYLGQEDYAKAIEIYRKYLAVVPQSAYAHHWIAIASVRSGDRETALAEEDAALAIDPRFVDSYVMKAGLLASRGLYDAAVAALEKALGVDPDNTGILNDLGAVYLEWKRLPEATGVFEKIVKIDPRYAPAWTSLGIISAARGDDAHAIDLFRKALAIAPSQAEARFNLAKSLATVKRLGEARRELETLIAQIRETRNARFAAMRQAAVEMLEKLPQS